MCPLPRLRSWSPGRGRGSPRATQRAGSGASAEPGLPTPAHSTWSGVKATLEAVPEERSRMVDFPPYTTLCFCSVRCRGGRGRDVWAGPGLSQQSSLTPGPTQPGPYLQRLGDPGFGGLVHLSLPHAPAARFAQMAQAEAQVLLVGVLLNLVGGKVSQSWPPSISQMPRRSPDSGACWAR